MRRILLILILFPFLCFSQETTVERPDKALEPDPHTRTYYFDGNDYKKIERVTTIAKNRYNDFKNDTLRKVYYNTEGNKLKTIKYKENSPSETIHYEYYPNKKLKSWKTVGGKSATYTLYFYDNDDRINLTKQYRIRSLQDSTLLSKKAFKYDKNGLIQIISEGNFSIKEHYKYQDDKLTIKSGGYISKTFEYDNEGNLIKVIEYMGGEVNPERIMGLKTFNYSNNLLKSDSILTSSNLANKDYKVTNYDYNGKLLKSVRVKYKDFYRNIDFKYGKDNKIIEVNVHTNRSNSAYLRHWISHRIEDFYGFPIQYKEIFEYDTYGNKTSKKIYVNDELFSDITYVIEY